MTKKTEQQAEVIRRLAHTVRILRENERMSLREFGEKLDVDHNAIVRLENGTNLNPSVFLINKIAAAFDMTVDELMNFNAKTCPTCKGRGWVK